LEYFGIYKNIYRTFPPLSSAFAPIWADLGATETVVKLGNNYDRDNVNLGYYFPHQGGAIVGPLWEVLRSIWVPPGLFRGGAFA